MLAAAPLGEPASWIRPETGLPDLDLLPASIRLLSPLFNVTGGLALVFGAIFSTYVFMPKRRVLYYSLDPNQKGDELAFNLVISLVAFPVNFVASLPAAIRAFVGGRLHSRGGHPLPAGHEGAAQGDAPARRQAGHPVRGRGSGQRWDRAGHHRHELAEAGDRGPLRPVVRARGPARGQGRHRDAAAHPPHRGAGPDQLRAPARATRAGPRRARDAGPGGARALRGDALGRRGPRPAPGHRAA